MALRPPRLKLPSLDFSGLAKVGGVWPALSAVPKKLLAALLKIISTKLFKIIFFITLVLAMLLGAWLLWPHQPAQVRIAIGSSSIAAPAPATKTNDAAPAAPATPANTPSPESSTADTTPVVPNVGHSSNAPIPPLNSPAQLTPAPQPALLEEMGQGRSLPQIGKDGQKPWRVYARPFDANITAPKIALIVGGLGLSRLTTENTLDIMPAEVTLAFDAYTNALPDWFNRARSEGHEVLLSVPAEPMDYPRSDPGPHMLLARGNIQANYERMRWLLSRGAGYVGLLNDSGTRFVTNRDGLNIVFDELTQRGLLWVDATGSRTTLSATIANSLALPHAVAGTIIDASLAETDILQALQQLEIAAHQNGFAVGYTHSYPLILSHLQRWLPSLAAKGIALVPVSAIAQSMPEPNITETDIAEPAITVPKIETPQAETPPAETPPTGPTQAAPENQQPPKSEPQNNETK